MYLAGMEQSREAILDLKSRILVSSLFLSDFRFESIILYQHVLSSLKDCWSDGWPLNLPRKSNELANW